KPALGSLATSTAAAFSAQMSQMGRINERGSSSSNNNNSEINAQINGGHLSPRAADVNGSALPVLLLGKSSAKAEKLTFLDDEEEEDEKEVKKRSSTSAAEEEGKVGKSFQELGRRLEAEISTLKAAFRSEMTASKKTTTDLLTSFKADLGGQVAELKGKVEGDRADIRFLGERLDQLWTSLKTVERAVEESRSRFEEKEREKKEENQEEILERLLEKALKERKRLDGESDGHFGQKVLEEKLSSAQAENGRQFSALRETINAKVAEVKRTSMENSRMAAEELREDLLKELASGQRELRVQFQQQSREDGKRLRAALSEEMEQRIGEELGRRMKKNAEEEEKRSSGVQVESILEQQLHQME
ncbi:PREDICTED: stress response protein NST1-like, partial [Rhagoletis zephyria]|uniref:stress response protein NST1-like n=1 Tax=Rhagoletis zephyria TaxID=28612 RepID=UPI0008115635